MTLENNSVDNWPTNCLPSRYPSRNLHGSSRTAAFSTFARMCFWGCSRTSPHGTLPNQLKMTLVTKIVRNGRSASRNLHGSFTGLQAVVLRILWDPPRRASLVTKVYFLEFCFTVSFTDPSRIFTDCGVFAKPFVTFTTPSRTCVICGDYAKG